MSFTTYWSPNQAAVAQVETYTFSAPNSVGNTYSATINGKVVTYSSASGDTAAAVATALLALLQAASGVPELSEITFANPSGGVLTATANAAGTPFANVTVNGVAGQGLVLSTGNGLSNGIATAHTQASLSPSDAGDAKNWLRYNMTSTPPVATRSLPQNGDNVVVGATATPILWNADALAAVQFNTYTRQQDMTGQVGLPLVNASGYQEWRACYFRMSGPQGSVPAGGLQVVLGAPGAGGSGPSFESYNVGSQLATLTVLGGGVVNFLGVHALNSFESIAGTLNVAVNPGEVATLNTSAAYSGAVVNVGSGVAWTAAAALTLNGAGATLNAAPATLALSNGASASVTTDMLTWAAVTAQGTSTLTWLAGGTITSLTLSTGSVLDKSGDPRALTVTNATLDGDTCQVLDPLGAVSWTNAATVKQQVSAGPFTFTGPRTVKVV